MDSLCFKQLHIFLNKILHLTTHACKIQHKMIRVKPRQIYDNYNDPIKKNTLFKKSKSLR